MASARQIAANRVNGAKGHGPRTAAGKLQASRNAWRHGLSVPLSRDPSVAAHIESIAAESLGGDATDQQSEWVRTVVEAQLELVRIRLARASFLAPSGRKVSAPVATAELIAFDRYEQRARGRRDSAMRKLRKQKVVIM